MERKEFRNYLIKIEDERTPQQWEEILCTLGNLGVTDVVQVNENQTTCVDIIESTTIEQTNATQPETETSDLIVDKSYFYEKAKELGGTHTIAGKAWTTLTVLYAGKNNRTYFENRLSYRYEDFAHVNLRFDYIPPLERGAMRLNGLTGLHMVSVVPLIKEYDRLLSKYNEHDLSRADKKLARERVFGKKVGEKTVEFLRQIVNLEGESKINNSH